MKFNTIDDLKAAGFEGFIPVAQLQTDSTAIPRTAGVYMVVYTGENMPEFLSVLYIIAENMHMSIPYLYYSQKMLIIHNFTG